MAKILVIGERRKGENRVAASPDAVKKYVKAGHTVFVERASGAPASFLDTAYEAAGATIVDLEGATVQEADVVLSVGPHDESLALDPEDLRAGAVWISFFEPDRNLKLVSRIARAGVTAISMEHLPRITRAQSMDALSSQANIAGYKAVLMGASEIPRFFPLLMTAAGTIRPAQVVVMGAGVAGLQAIATAKRLGAVVQVSDIRPEVEEQVQSLGAKFIPLPDMGSGSGDGGYAKEMTEDFLEKQREIVATYLEKADVVVTTALIPGRPAPKLIEASVVQRMKPGAVIVDIAAPRGGNCELTQADQRVVENHVVILGPTNLPSTMAADASALYAQNLASLSELLFDEEGNVTLDLEDEILDAAVLTHSGEVRHAATRESIANA